MVCDYCGEEAEKDEEGEPIMFRKSAGDESLDLCESCHEHYYG